MVFSEKKPELLKTANISQFDVECDWNSKFSQNFQKLDFFAEKDGFSEKNIEIVKMARGFNLAVQCNWKSKISQSVQNLFFFYRK